MKNSLSSNRIITCYSRTVKMAALGQKQPLNLEWQQRFHHVQPISRSVIQHLQPQHSQSDGEPDETREASQGSLAVTVPHCVHRFLHSAINNTHFLPSVHCFTDKNEAKTRDYFAFLQPEVTRDRKKLCDKPFFYLFNYLKKHWQEMLCNSLRKSTFK